MTLRLPRRRSYRDGIGKSIHRPTSTFLFFPTICARPSFGNLMVAPTSATLTSKYTPHQPHQTVTPPLLFSGTVTVQVPSPSFRVLLAHRDAKSSFSLTRGAKWALWPAVSGSPAKGGAGWIRFVQHSAYFWRHACLDSILAFLWCHLC